MNLRIITRPAMSLIGQEISRDILKNIMAPLGHRMKI